MAAVAAATAVAEVASRAGPPESGAAGGERPLVPAVDLASVATSLLGDPSIDDTIADNLVTDDGPPRLFTPFVPDARGSGSGAAPAVETLPLMFYLPGIDGTGLAAYRQFPRLMSAFDLRCLVIAPSDRSSFEQLLGSVEAVVRASIQADGSGRPVYLLGESFGGLLCLALSERLGDMVDRLVLVNPATAFSESVWPSAGPLLSQLPPEVYKLLPFGLAPVLCDPLAMARNDVDERAPLTRQASDYLYGLLDLIPQLSALRIVLPPATLAWRMELLRQGCEHVAPKLKDVKHRALVVAGQRDLLIPSAEEAERLAKVMPRCRRVVLEGRSHAVLQEAGVDLVQILQSEGFYSTSRVLSNGRPSTGASDSGATAFGTPSPLQLPTPAEIAWERDGSFVSTIRKLCSPVYYSTLADGSVVRGFGGVPRRVPGGGDGPLLFIANHGLFAVDMYTMIPDMLEATGILPRGLAHPAVFAGTDAFRSEPSSGSGSGSDSSSSSSNGGGGAGSFANLLSSYGAVPVSAFSMHRLLSNGDNVLLYPGGAREAFKRKGEAYQLIWPEKAEFVRLAAKFGATIIPVASVGADEGVTQLLDIGEVAELQKQLPTWLNGGSAGAGQQRRRIPAARVGVNATMEDVEAFGLPLIAPTVPKRFYFLFGAPIQTSPDLAADRDACQRLYGEVKSAVEDGLGYLLRRRESDPYRDLVPRVAYEASWGWDRQAPSFDP